MLTNTSQITQVRAQGYLRVWALVFFALALLALSTSAAHAGPINVVQNGSFEATSLSSPGGYICQAGKTCVSNVTSWGSACDNNSCGTGATVASLLFANTGGSAFNGGIGLWSTANSPDGGNYIAIDGDPTYVAPLTQTINGLFPGTYYTLTFYQAAAQQKGTTGNNTEQWKVTFGGAPSQSSTLISNPSQQFQPWTQQTMTFQATLTSQVLTFLAVGTPNGGPPVALLDGVSMTAQVPEPLSFGLVGLGLVALPLLRRSRRAK